MKYIFSLILIFLLIIFSVWITLKNPSLTDSISTRTEPLLSSSIELKNHVSHLSEKTPTRHYYDQKTLNEAALYIESTLKKFCPEVTIKPFLVEKNEYKNIECKFYPEQNKRILIGAHYDVANNGPGADDNASGVAGLLELARIIKENPLNGSLGLDIVAFSLEEQPNFMTDSMGSYVHAKELHDNKVNLELMISLEMLGFFSDQDYSQKYPNPLLYLFYPHQGNFIVLSTNLKTRKQTRKLRRLFNTHSKLPFYSINAPSFIPGVDWSDNRNFAHFGYNAYMLTDTAFYRNPNYHKTTDLPDTLNYNSMAEIIHGLYMMLKNYSK